MPEKIEAYRNRGPSQKALRILELYTSGKTYKQIMDELGCTEGSIRGVMDRARKRGEDVLRGKPDAALRNIVPHRKLGNLMDMFNRLEPEVIVWLDEVSPAGVTLSHQVSRIVRQEYLKQMMRKRTEENQNGLLNDKS